MKKSLRLMALALIAIITLASCSQDPASGGNQSASIRGSVSIPSGAGFTGSDFFVQTMDGDTVVQVGKAGSDGSFVISGLEDGKIYNVILTTVDPSSSRDVSRAASGYGGWLNNVAAAVGEQVTTKPVAVRPLGTIRGNVWREGASDGYDTRVFIPGTSYSADTDEFGNYAISNVPQSENPYRIRFTAAGYSAKMVEVLLYSSTDEENPEAIAPETSLFVNVGTLEGTAKLYSQQDSTGISVMVQNGSFSKMGSTDRNGSFTIYDIKPGTYTVTVSYPGYLSQTIGNVSISESSTTTLPNTITLQQASGKVSGSIYIHDETDYSGVTVTVSGNGRSYSAVTDSDGRYSVSVAQGNYDTVSFSKPCVVGKSLSRSIAVFSGNSFEMDTVGLNAIHSYALHDSKESSCTEAGYKLYRCQNCSKEKTETLPLKEHEKNIIESKDADCTHDGYIKFECSMCGQTLTEDLPALGHSWGTPEVISESTCHDEGSQKVTCTVCGEEETQTIEKLAHAWKNNGFKDGQTEYVCVLCGDTKYVSGAETDELGRQIIAILPNDVTLLRTPGGNMVFQLKLKNTDRNYREEGYPESSWPTYSNTFNIDLTDSVWEAFIGKKVRISQEIRYYLPNGGSNTSASLSIQPGGNLNGLYDLSGKESVSLISDLKTPYVDANDLRFEIGVLLPLEAKVGGSAVRFTELPTVIVFDGDFSPEKAYIISLRDIPETPYSNGFFSNIITSIVGSNGLKYIGTRNGEPKNSTGYVMNITKHDGKFDADLYVTGIEEDFMLYINDLDYNTNQFGDYGTISIQETKDTTWPQDNAIDLSKAEGGTLTVKNDKEWTIIWSLPEGDNSSYKLKFSTEAIGLTQRWGTYRIEGGAGRPFNDEFVISRTENTHGFVTVYSQPDQETLTWTIEKQ